MAGTVKRKSRKSSSTSSTDDSLSPIRRVLAILNMAGEVIPKLEQALEKRENLERYVKAVDEKGSDLQAKVDCFESFKSNRRKDQRA